MTPRGVCDSAFDMNAGGKRRVHENDGRADRVIEIVIDVGGIMLRYGRSGKEQTQNAVAEGRIFVERKTRMP